MVVFIILTFGSMSDYVFAIVSAGMLGLIMYCFSAFSLCMSLQTL